MIYYLKKVNAVLYHDKAGERMDLLGQKLTLEGIRYERGCKQPETEKAEKTESPGTLWVTDSPGQATAWKKEGKPVLFYFYEEPGEKLSAASKQRNPDFCVEYAMEKPEELDALFLENIYRRLVKIPWEIVRTKRCIVRETIPTDIEPLLAIYAEPSVTRYMEPICKESEDAHAAHAVLNAYIEKVYPFYGYGIWSILDREDGKVIGRAGFSVGEAPDCPELGYCITPKKQGKGLAGEVCSALLAYAKEELLFQRVCAVTDRENAASAAVCRHLGFEARETFEKDGREFIAFRKELL